MLATKEIVSKLDPNIVNNLVSSLKSKGINKFTIIHVIDFIAMHNHCFEGYISQEQMAKNLNNVIVSNITTEVPKPIKQTIKKRPGIMSAWVQKDEKVVPNKRQEAVIFVKEKYFNDKSQKDFLDSIIRHELDHALNSHFISDINDSKTPIMISGFNNCEKFHETTILNEALIQLNESLVVYKQKKMDEALGVIPKELINIYKHNTDEAKHIMDTIGEKELIRCAYNNDFNTVRNLYNRKNNIDLSDVLETKCFMDSKEDLYERISKEKHYSIPLSMDDAIEITRNELTNQSQYNYDSNFSEYNDDFDLKEFNKILSGYEIPDEDLSDENSNDEDSRLDL